MTSLSKVTAYKYPLWRDVNTMIMALSRALTLHLFFFQVPGFHCCFNFFCKLFVGHLYFLLSASTNSIFNLESYLTRSNFLLFLLNLFRLMNVDTIYYNDCKMLWLTRKKNSACKTKWMNWRTRANVLLRILERSEWIWSRNGRKNHVTSLMPSCCFLAGRVDW